MTITYRTAGAWGAGKGADLTAVEVDLNFYDLDGRLLDLETNPPVANGIASISQAGAILTVTYDDASSDTFNLPVAGWVWKGQWSASAFSNGQAWPAGSVFSVIGQGVYLTLIGHTTVTPFDENRQIGGEDVYAQIFGDSGTPYDLPFDLNDNPAAGEILARVRVARDLVIQPDFAGAAAGKSAFDGVDPVSVYTISIRDDAVEIGTVTLTPSTGGVSVAWATAGGAQQDVAAGSELTFHAPDQGTAQDTSIAFWSFVVKAAVAV